MSITISGDKIQVNLSKIEFRKEAVNKFLNRGKRAVGEIAKEVGVTNKTLYLWVDRYAFYNDVVKRNPNSMQKLKLVIEYDSLEEQSRGKFLRENGLYSEQLEQWREAVMKKNLETYTEKTLQKILEAKNDEIEKLQKELRRKDKALAEANACMLLQKKAEEMFSDEDEE